MSVEGLHRRLREVTARGAKCDDGLRLLALALLSDSKRELDCETCQALIPEYVQAEVLGRDKVRPYAAMRAHLLLCPECERDYIGQLEVAWQLTQDAVPHAQVRPAFDLTSSQIEAASTRPAPAPQPARPQAWWTQLRPAISGLKALFVSFIPLGTFSPALSLDDQGFETDVEQGVERRRLVETAIPQVEDGMLTVAAIRPRGGASCSLIVRIDAPGWEPAGRRVRMFYGGGVREIKTDALGQAEFDNIPVAILPDLQIELPDLAL